MKTLQLHDGGRMPAFGLGTWKSDPGEVGTAVQEAIRLGYRHIDCAAIYGNEQEVGEALATCFDAGLVTRDELWITSKLWNDRHAPEDVGPALQQTLSDLRLEHLDLYLIHWPVALKKGKLVPDTGADMIPLEELPTATTWQALEEQVDAGRSRYIGVSNFSLPKLSDLHARARVPVAANQIELHPYLQQQELVDWCQQQGVVVTAYSPLGSVDRPEGMRRPDEPRLLEDPVITEIALRHDAAPAQVLIAWALARNTAVIPKTVHKQRLLQNLSATGLELGRDDLRRIAELDRHRRYVDGSFWVLPDGPYSLTGLWDE